MSLFLGIDTSNYTTSLALSDESGVLVSLKEPVRVKSGERGIRQSDALFSHTVNLPKLFEKLGKQQISAVGVSAYPRDVEGSYMPCFLAGISAAEAISSTLGVPLYRFSHQRGHVAAALYSAGRLDLLNDRFCAFHVSGGTTEILLVEGASIRKIGGTLDLNAGQIIDRVGVLLGYDFPCGPALEKNAAPFEECDCRTFVRGLECNLSGLENKAQEMLSKGVDKAKIAGYTLKSVLRTLDKLSESLKGEYPDLPIVYAGGVMSNQVFQKELAKRPNVYFSEPAFSADNAAGVSVLCREKFEGRLS